MWVLDPGWQPLGGIGPGPFADAQFEELAEAYAAANGFTRDDVVANGPYLWFEGEPPAPEPELPVAAVPAEEAATDAAASGEGDEPPATPRRRGRG